MSATIGRFEPQDEDAVIDLSLRAWEPVFTSLENVLGDSGVYAQLYPNWCEDQRRAVQDACRCEHTTIWVAKTESLIAGFVAVQLDHEACIGQIYMIAVDPNHQRLGLGARLTQVALDWIGQAGMTVAMVETGGDKGHAPARELYEHAGFTQLPIARYFKKL